MLLGHFSLVAKREVPCYLPGSFTSSGPDLLHRNMSVENRGKGHTWGMPANRPFPSCCEPHYESEAKCKTFHMKINFVLHMNEN